MQDIIYDVAVSADGFIAAIGDDVTAFPHEGPHVAAYMARLQSYGTAIMGRRTYEFGYKFGMEPGQNPYPHMRTLVFSSTLDLPAGSAVETVRTDGAAVIQALRKTATAPIYLCGGGAFAGGLREAGLITRLRLKRAPIVLGAGVRLFGDRSLPVAMSCVETQAYENHVIYQDFHIGPMG